MFLTGSSLSILALRLYFSENNLGKRSYPIACPAVGRARVTESRLREKTKVTSSAQTLVAKRLATVYAHPRHAPRKDRAVFCSPALALCPTAAAASFDFSPRAHFGHHLAATSTQRSRQGARPNSLLYLLRIGYSVPVSFLLRHLQRF